MTKVRVDWFRVLIDLEQRGFHPQVVSDAINVARSTILGWRNSHAEPGHTDGERIIDLWCRVTGRARINLPLNLSEIISAAKAKA